MKTLFLSSLVASVALFAAVPMQAAQLVANVSEARGLVQDEGYIIFAYADGWDDFSEARCRKLVADKAILKAAGNAVLLLVPVPEMPDDARRAEQEALLGGIKLPDVRSYPALIFLYKDGGHYATLLGQEVTRGSSRDLAELIRQRVAAGQERYRMLRKAETESGPARARLIFKASQVEGLVWMGKWANEAIRQSDPKNETGILDSLNFNAYGFANNLGKNGVKAGLEQVDKMLANSVYTPRQKQQICAAALGMLRRDGGPAGATAMRRYARLMQELVPESPEGQAAARILETWIPELRYDRGWNPSCLPIEPTPVEVVGELPVDEAGTYTVRFQYTHGNMGLSLFGVALYDGEHKVAEDQHTGFAGYNNKQNEYTLVVPRALKKPRLLITLGQEQRGSHGRIVIEKKAE